MLANKSNYRLHIAGITQKKPKYLILENTIFLHLPPLLLYLACCLNPSINFHATYNLDTSLRWSTFSLTNAGIIFYCDLYYIFCKVHSGLFFWQYHAQLCIVTLQDLPGPILESKGKHVIFQKKGKKGQHIWNLGKNIQNLQIFWKRACDCMWLSHAINFRKGPAFTSIYYVNHWFNFCLVSPAFCWYIMFINCFLDQVGP